MDVGVLDRPVFDETIPVSGFLPARLLSQFLHAVDDRAELEFYRQEGRYRDLPGVIRRFLGNAEAVLTYVSTLQSIDRTRCRLAVVERTSYPLKVLGNVYEVTRLDPRGAYAKVVEMQETGRNIRLMTALPRGMYNRFEAVREMFPAGGAEDFDTYFAACYLLAFARVGLVRSAAYRERKCMMMVQGTQERLRAMGSGLKLEVCVSVSDVYEDVVYSC